MSWDWNPGFMKCIFPLSFQLRITKQSRREQEETETGLQDNKSPHATSDIAFNWAAIASLSHFLLAVQI